MACLHKEFSPLNEWDAVGIVVLFMGGILAGASGIGGGGLNVPLMLLIMNFLFEEAIPLSHIMVLGNAVAQNLVNGFRRHPLAPHRPMIDFDVPLLLLPMQLGGNALGVLLFPVFPSGLLLTLAVVILTVAAVKTIHRGIKDFKQELKASRCTPLLEEGSDGELGVPSPTPLLTAPEGKGLASEAEGKRAPEKLKIEPLSAEEQRKQTKSNCLKVLALIGFWIFFVIEFFGSKGHSNCSATFIAWQVALFVFALLTIAPGAYLARASAASRQTLPGDIDWSKTPQLLLAVVAALFIGLVSGLLGLGGGELMAPLLLALGMLPQCGSATSGFMIVFTSASNLVHYLSEGDVLKPMEGYVVLFAFLGFTSAFTGRMASMFCVRKLHHPSLIVFSLGALLVIATLLLIVRSIKTPPGWAFSDLCDD
uniref:Uncharacterized protein n=1 Tax=Coccolithus braarudii TaxID=221442 RepID=A0A7S0PXU7_9EUKA